MTLKKKGPLKKKGRKPREFPYCTGCQKTRKNPDEQIIKGNSTTKVIACKVCERRLSWSLRKKQLPKKNNTPRRHTPKELEELKNHRRRIREAKINA